MVYNCYINSNEYGDIITFYNKVYIKDLKPFLLTIPSLSE